MNMLKSHTKKSKIQSVFSHKELAIYPITWCFSVHCLVYLVLIIIGLVFICCILGFI